MFCLTPALTPTADIQFLKDHSLLGKMSISSTCYLSSPCGQESESVSNTLHRQGQREKGVVGAMGQAGNYNERLRWMLLSRRPSQGLPILQCLLIAQVQNSCKSVFQREWCTGLVDLTCLITQTHTSAPIFILLQAKVPLKITLKTVLNWLWCFWKF